MGKAIQALLNRVSGLHEAAYLLAILTFLSQVLGLVRDRMLGGTFGAGETLDIYYAAFKVPDLIFLAVASLVSISILVPYFTAKKEGNDLSEAVNGIFTFYSTVVVLVSLLAFAFAPIIMPVLFPGIAADRMPELVNLSRIMLLSPIALGISNFFGSIAQVFGRFFLYGLSPILYNAGIILGIVFFYPRFGLYGLGAGVVLGALLHAAVYIPFLLKERLLPRYSASSIRRNAKSVGDVARLSLPRALALSASSISIMVLLAIASLIGPGSISAFNLSFNLQAIPLSIIAVSYASAAFPLLSRLFAEGKREAFVREAGVVIRHTLVLTLLASALFIALSDKIVHVILATGAFSARDAALVAALLSIFSLSVVPQSLVGMFVRMFYAEGKTARPFFLNLTAAVFTCSAAFAGYYILTHDPDLARSVGSALGLASLSGSAAAMLPIAYVIGSAVNAVLHWIVIEKDFPGFSRGVLTSFAKSAAAALVAGFMAMAALRAYEVLYVPQAALGTLLEGIVAGFVGLSCGIAALYVLGSEELQGITAAFKRKVFKTEVPPAEELHAKF